MSGQSDNREVSRKEAEKREAKGKGLEKAQEVK